MLRALDPKKSVWNKFKQTVSNPYRNDPKNRFLPASALPHNFDSHSRLALEQWSLAPNRNSEEPPWYNPDSSDHSGMRLKISAEVDPHSGHPSLGMALDKFGEKDIKDAVQDLFSEISKLGDKVIIAIDEFQKISQIEDKGWLEATLRSFMQQLKNTSFLLTGSRKSLVFDMLNNSSRPLYRSAQIIEFPSFGGEFTEWLVGRFLKAKIKCETTPIEHLRKMVQDTPNYVQMICFHLVAEGKTAITSKEVEMVLSKVARQNAYAYQTLLNTLTLTQQRSLRLAAKEGKQVFHQNLLQKYEIGSGAALSSALKALKDKGILDEQETYRGSVVFDDPLFAFWLRNSLT